MLVIADGGCTDQEYVDACFFPRNLVSDLKKYFDIDPSLELKDVLDESLEMNPCNGSSTVVMAKLEER